MNRVTLKDAAQTITFLTDAGIAGRLIAGCSSNPGTIGELLLATEVFRRGITVAIMKGLIAFDKAHQQKGPAEALAIATAAKDEGIVWGAVQVVDDQTAALARDDADAPLLILDLTTRTIRASGAVEVQTSGEIQAHDGQGLTGRAITYVLPQEWDVQLA
jgi:hypothetical protein